MNDMTARAAFGVIFVPDLGNVARDLIFSLGDFRQRYDGAGSNAPGNIAPDYRTIQPTVTYELYEANTGNPVDSQNVRVNWYFKGALLAFGTDGVCTGETESGATAQTTKYKGLFMQIVPTISAAPYKLKILDNLVTAAGASCILTATATIDNPNGQSSSNISASIAYSIVQTSQSDYSLTIMPVGAGSINFRDDTVYDDIKKRWGYITLKAEYLQGVSPMTPHSIAWEVYNGTAFVDAASAGLTVNADGTLKVTCEDVASQLLVRATATANPAGEGRASDIHTVVDHSDPLVIIRNCTPADMMLKANESPDFISFKPILSATEDKQDEIKKWNGAFDVAVLGEAGEFITNQSLKITKGGEFRLYKNAFIQSGNKHLIATFSTTNDTSGALALADCGNS